jgi:rhodanese-related sulfurtransferase
MLVGKVKTRHDELAKSKLPPDEVAELLRQGALLVDVRPKIGAKIGMAPGAINISLFTLKRRLHELPRDRKIVLYCHSGAAAGKARQTLDALGFKAFNGGGYEDILKIVGTMNKRREERKSSGRRSP